MLHNRFELDDQESLHRLQSTKRRHGATLGCACPASAPPRNRRRKCQQNGPRTKVFVIDTSVLLHDHNAIRSFEDNSIAIPITVLEELDTFKVGNDTKNFEARECIRIIDQLSKDFTLQDWIPLDNEGAGFAHCAELQRPSQRLDAARVFDKKTNDHKILSAALQLQHDEPDMKVVWSPKTSTCASRPRHSTFRLRISKRAKVKDKQHLYSGKTLFEGVDARGRAQDVRLGQTRKISVLGKERKNNHFYILRNQSASAWASLVSPKAHRARRQELCLRHQAQECRTGLCACTPF